MQDDENTSAQAENSSLDNAAAEGAVEASETLPEKKRTLRRHGRYTIKNIALRDESDDGNTPELTSQEDKISALRASLLALEQREEDEFISAHVAQQIQHVKEKRNRPEHEKKEKVLHKKTMGERFLNFFPQRGDGVLEITRKSIVLLALTVLIICLILIAWYYIDLAKARSAYESIGYTYHARSPEYIEESDTEPQTTYLGGETYSLLSGAQELLAINEEIVGWISIPDTQIDYPVMQHREDSEGDEYYLYRDTRKEDSRSGSIFLDYRCDFDCVGDDGKLTTANSDNLIIYGHNMRDASMFGTLKRYWTDDDYYEEHPVIELSSNYKTYQYKIIGYFIADAEDQTETRFDYWNDITFENEEAFYDYVNEVKRRTIRITNVDVTYGDSLLTLSTCNSAFDTARLVIVARRVRDGEDPYERVQGSTPNPNIKWPTVYYDNHDITYDPERDFAPYG